MNDTWSRCVQGPNTLYSSRKLRFDDLFAAQYKALFHLNPHERMSILEIGCGPGALAGALHRWYPNAEIAALDRDTEFIRFAREHEQGIQFMEGDATALPFEDNHFDAVISNTVVEHIEPSRFYLEQLRVLKPGGVCLVLSSRRGITVAPKCAAPGEYEQAFWKRAAMYDDTLNRYGIGKYHMNEAELPSTMESYGFKNITTGYVLVDLTPDHPKFSTEQAHRIINANRYSDLESIDSVLHTMPEHFSPGEIQEMKRITNAKYDARIAQYDRGEKQWDTEGSIIMVMRGEK